MPRERLHELLAASDAVVVTAPSTPETRGMLGEAEFRAMRPTAWYINVSRGDIADRPAMLRALEEGWIAGAGLDAHAIEPLPDDALEWRMPNVIVTPHNGSTSHESRARAVEAFRENLALFAAGRPLTAVVDKQVGYQRRPRSFMRSPTASRFSIVISEYLRESTKPGAPASRVAATDARMSSGPV